MSVAKMKLVTIIGHMNSMDNVVSVCAKSNVFQPDDVMSFFSGSFDFTTIQEDNPYSDPISVLEAAISRIPGKLKTTNLLSALPDNEMFDYVDQFAARSSALSKQRGELSIRIEAFSKDIEQYEHFKGLNVELNSILECETIKARFGRLPKESFEKLRSYNNNPYVLFFPGTSDAEYYWGVYFAPIGFTDDVDRIFSSLYFERLRIPSAIGTPEEIVNNLQAQKDEVAKELDELKKEIETFWINEQSECMQIYSRLRQLSYYFGVRKSAARYNDKFILAGWIPLRNERAFDKALDSIDGIEYTIEQGDQDIHHTPPVTLRNPSLFRPFEFFVGMYGLPRYNEIDPTAFVAITFTVLFGIMFGDLGQGICVTIIGWLMWKYKQMPVGKILIPCGISAAFFGTVFGSVFGFEHVLDPVYKALFGWEEKPIEVLQSSMTINIILSAIVIGLTLTIIAMFINIYSSFKRRDYENALFGPNGIAGLVFYSSLVSGLAGELMFHIHLLTLPYILCLIVLPLFLVFLREPLGKLAEHEPEWKPEKWGEFCVQNFFEVFELLLSYLSNTMSFLRVGAFVLVHAGMMMAVFTLADLAKGNIGYPLIVIFGNGLVLVMEALLVSIQVLRLEFYEMFSRYYNGDGRAFKPLSVSSEDNK